jgi:hypothetical protein
MTQIHRERKRRRASTDRGRIKRKRKTLRWQMSRGIGVRRESHLKPMSLRSRRRRSRNRWPTVPPPVPQMPIETTNNWSTATNSRCSLKI